MLHEKLDGEFGVNVVDSLVGVLIADTIAVSLRGCSMKGDIVNGEEYERQKEKNEYYRYTPSMQIRLVSYSRVYFIDEESLIIVKNVHVKSMYGYEYMYLFKNENGKWNKKIIIYGKVG